MIDQKIIAPLPDQFFKTVFDTLSTQLAVLDAEGTIVVVNAAWRRFAAANNMPDPDAGVGTNYLEICESASGEGGEAAFVAAKGLREIIAQQRDEFFLEYPCHSPDEERWFMMRARRFEDGPGRIMVVHENITERKQAERALQESEELHRITLSNISDAVFITDDGGWFTYVCPNVSVIFGYSVPEVIALGSIYKLLGNHLFTRDKLDILGEIQNIEREVADKVGEKHSLLINVKRVAIKDGTILFTCRDVTQRRQAQAANAQLYEEAQLEIARRQQVEETLREREERFRQVVISISDHIYVTRIASDGGRVNLYISPHVEALTGYPRAAVTDNWQFWASGLIHPDDRAAAAAQAEALAGGENSEVEYRLVRADGSIIWVRDSARVQTEGDARVVYGLVSDITERKRAEAEIQQLNETLEQRVVDRTRELSALYDVTAAASESLELETILARLLIRSLAAMRSSQGTIHTLDEAKKTLRLDVQQALPADIIDQMNFVSSGSGLPGWVVEQGEPLLVPDLAAEPRAPRAAQAHNLNSYVGVPMRTGGQVVGVLSVFGQALRQFNMEEVALLASIGDQVGGVIENARLRLRAEEAAVLEERERLARDLHDAVSQSLFSASVIAETLPRIWDRNPELTQRSLLDLHRLTRGALAEMRALLLELRPAALTEIELDKLLRQLTEAIIGRTQIDVSLKVEGQPRLPLEVKLTLYRIAQEALNNISKHARANQVTVQLQSRPERVVLRISDNGRGFNPHQISLGQLGLSIMRERAKIINAALEITSQTNEGTDVVVSWPQP